MGIVSQLKVRGDDAGSWGWNSRKSDLLDELEGQKFQHRLRSNADRFIKMTPKNEGGL